MSLPAQQEQQEQLLGPRSVVVRNQLHEERWGLWLKLADDQDFAQLHTKFWSKSMLVEEEEWRRKQGSDDPDCEVDLMDADGDDDENGDIGLGCYMS